MQVVVVVMEKQKDEVCYAMGEWRGSGKGITGLTQMTLDGRAGSGRVEAEGEEGCM